MRRRLLSIQYLLLAVRKQSQDRKDALLLITFRLLIRSVLAECVFVRARTKGDESVPEKNIKPVGLGRGALPGEAWVDAVVEALADE